MNLMCKIGVATAAIAATLTIACNFFDAEDAANTGNIPWSYDGENVFTFELRLSEELKSGVQVQDPAGPYLHGYRAAR